MKDIFWFIVVGIMFLLIGFILIKLGFDIWKKQEIQLINEHHYEKVSEKDKLKFCKLSGIGVFIIGVGITSSGICISITESLLSFIPITIGLIIGITLLIWAVTKYNRIAE